MSGVAKVGLRAWFFGNIYEEEVGLPQLLAYAQAERPPGLLTAGSPVPGLARGEDRRRDRQATGIISALALTGYLIRSINLPLLNAREPLTDLEQADLCGRWQRGRAVRLALVGAALTLQRSS